MHPARIAELLQPFVSSTSNLCHSEQDRMSGEEPAVLSPTQLQHISTYIDILLRWNARINLTAIRDPEDIVTRHFGESLFAARHLFPTPAIGSCDAHVGTAALGCPAERSSAVSTAADLGSGAGFPGIPIKLWAPHLILTLIESNQKKTAFLREVIRALTLMNVNVLPARAEQLLEQPATSSAGEGPARHPGFDLVTLRAVERFASILPVAARLVSPGGRLALLIGSRQLDQAQAALPTLAWDHPLPIPQSQSRTLLIARLP
jgi:16S rRNA (guanine527-N7)-methyltransferase